MSSCREVPPSLRPRGQQLPSWLCFPWPPISGGGGGVGHRVWLAVRPGTVALCFGEARKTQWATSLRAKHRPKRRRQIDRIGADRPKLGLVGLGWSLQEVNSANYKQKLGLGARVSFDHVQNPLVHKAVVAGVPLVTGRMLCLPPLPQRSWPTQTSARSVPKMGGGGCPSLPSGVQNHWWSSFSASPT